jgi:hypothetical protein
MWLRKRQQTLWRLLFVVDLRLFYYHFLIIKLPFIWNLFLLLSLRCQKYFSTSTWLTNGSFYTLCRNIKALCSQVLLITAHDQTPIIIIVIADLKAWGWFLLICTNSAIRIPATYAAIVIIDTIIPKSGKDSAICI